ncbi:MAG: DUF2330 domain-containing protein [Phycisphaerae bacterium]|nr:DUF2330 domain-containing protein [Phycisphaerae bacterium]
MRTVITVVLLTLISAAIAGACCMVPHDYPGSISQNAHEALILHDQGREELVLRIDYKITGKAAPPTFAWVITVPSEPDAYAIADKKIFKDMDGFASMLRPRTPSLNIFPLADSARPKVDSIELGKRVQVGPYDIQPVRGVGPNALAGLNDWLKSNGFPTEDPAHMSYFVKRRFTFLCIRIDPPKDAKAVGKGGKLPPMHLSFASEKPYYPLRFSSRQGVFDVNLHLLTREKLDYKTSAEVLGRLRWSNANYRRNVPLEELTVFGGVPKSLAKVFEKSRLKDKKKNWIYNNIRGRKVNANNAIAGWKTDIFFNGIPDQRQARVEGDASAG